MEKENTSIRLKKIMEKRNLRQVDILNLTKPYCEKYNVKMNKSDISQYVSGKNEPSQEKLVVLGMALNVSEAWLMGYDVPMERKSDAQKFNDYAKQYNATHTQYMLNKNECLLLSEYRKLNSYGKNKLITTAKEMNCSPLYNDNYQTELAAAHHRTDVAYSAEEAQADYDMMSDDNF